MTRPATILSRRSSVAGNSPIPLFRAPVDGTAAAALAPVFAVGQLAAGHWVAQFEAALAAYLGLQESLATSDRSGALTLALRLAGVGPGAEVVLSPLVCLATSMPIANLFATPVWCDVDPHTGMCDVDDVARRITPRTKAIVLYHWAGDVGSLAALRALADAHRIALISDASAALGAVYRQSSLACAPADYTVLSFYAVNPLTTGDGGALICRDPMQRERARRLRRYGIHHASFRLANGDLNPDSDIPEMGYNFAPTNLSGALGLAQLDGLDSRLTRQHANGKYFDHALAEYEGLTLLQRDPATTSAYWVYALRAARRDDLIRKLASHGIGAQRLHLRSDRYSYFSAASTLPGVDLFDRENLCIPSGWWVDAEARVRIVQCIQHGW